MLPGFSCFELGIAGDSLTGFSIDHGRNRVNATRSRRPLPFVLILFPRLCISLRLTGQDSVRVAKRTHHRMELVRLVVQVRRWINEDG
jgi:hypothetical protein